MNVNPLFLVSNPFIQAYVQSDFLGKMIFIGLILLSVITWVILIQKVWLTKKAKKNARQFSDTFTAKKTNPLGVELPPETEPNPFSELYRVLKKHTLDILNKNRGVSKEQTYLSQADISFVEAHLSSSIASLIASLEKNLYILPTVVTLGPFLGLLGTVWGILTTFGELQSQTGGNTNQMVIGGLSLALATTVLGLLDAIPALIGYNYLKNSIRDFETEMEGFSTEILATVEMQYRKVDV